MSQKPEHFELPEKIESLMASLSKLYSQKGRAVEQQIIVNSKIEIREGWEPPNWNEETYGHALHLKIPDSIFFNIVDNKPAYEERIRIALNKLHNVENEYIARVGLELNARFDTDWRQSSGLQIPQEKHVAPDAEKRIWGTGLFRVFLTHKAEEKEKVGQLKKELATYGISGFVAHEDIEPTKEWQDEIENALFTMDAMVALMTKDFHDSDWTDQEIGCAFGRGIRVIPVRMGCDPYGFIAKYQAVSASWGDASKAIVKVLIENDEMKDAYIKAVERCGGYDNANRIATVLPFIKNLSDVQVKKLIEAHNGNSQIYSSYGFDGSQPSKFGPGLVEHLKRITGKKFSCFRNNQIVVSND